MRSNLNGVRPCGTEEYLLGRADFLFAWFLATARLRSTVSRAGLGALWLILEPLSQALIFGVFFLVLLDPDSRPANYPMAVMVGVMSIASVLGPLSMANEGYRSAWNFKNYSRAPRLTLLFSRALEAAVLSALNLIVLLPFALVLGEPSWLWFLAPITLFASIPVTLGIILVAGSLQSLIPDLEKIVPSVGRIIFFGSGIFWSVENVLEKYPVALFIMDLNPGWHVIEATREIFFQNPMAAVSHFEALLVIGLVFVVAGLLLDQLVCRLGSRYE